MRFIHTSDWHIGRIFHGMHLTDDQSFVLDQLVDIIAQTRPDAILVAGDIYDRAVPPPEAVSLLNDTVSRIARDLGVPLFIIAGNHDSPERLGFASSLLSRNALHIATQTRSAIEPITINDEYGSIDIHLVPYAEPPVIREQLSDASVTDHATGMQKVIDQIRARQRRAARSILVAHAFVTGADECESERPLSIGGTGAIDANVFAGFDYVALGHLHRPQSFEGGRVQYSGSLMKYSLSEIDHVKGVNFVQMDKTGAVSIETIPLRPRKDLRRVTGYLKDLLRPHGTVNADYIVASILDDGPIIDAIGQLRDVYPGILHIERPTFSRTIAGGSITDTRKVIKHPDLFRSFFQHVTGNGISPEQFQAYTSTIEQMSLQEREATNETH